MGFNFLIQFDNIFSWWHSTISCCVCCFWEIQNHSNSLAPVSHFIFLPGGPENFSESLKLHMLTILEFIFWYEILMYSKFRKFSWIMALNTRLLFFCLLERHQLHETFWTHLSLKLSLSFSWSAFYHICILLSCVLAICNLILISVTIFSSSFLSLIWLYFFLSSVPFCSVFYLSEGVFPHFLSPNTGFKMFYFILSITVSIFFCITFFFFWG